MRTLSDADITFPTLYISIYICRIIESNHHHHSLPSSIPLFLRQPLGTFSGATRFSSYPVTGSFSRSVRENPGTSLGGVGYGCFLRLWWLKPWKYSFKQPLILKERGFKLQTIRFSLAVILILSHVNLLRHGKLSRHWISPSSCADSVVVGHPEYL